MDGEATADDLTALRPHIPTCLSCRAALREYRSAPRTAAALVPAAAFAAPDRLALLEVPARALEGLAGWAHKANSAVEMATAQKVAAVAASTAVIGGGAAVTVQQVERGGERPQRAAHVERVKAPPARVIPPAPITTAPEPVAVPAPQQQSEATRREARVREIERTTPPAQQEFEPAWAASEPTPTTATATAAATNTTDPAPKPTRPGGGAEEFAP